MSAQKVWLITGTSTGLGRSLAETVIARGDMLVATVRNQGAGRELTELAPDRVKVVTMDVTDAAAIRSCVQEAYRAFGRIDVLVNNAGYGLFGAVEEITEEQIRRQLETNLTGSILMTKEVLPRMREQRSGHIIQISSVGGQLATPGLSIYHATKWGIEGFCESLAGEVAAFGIRVTIVEPGGIRTDWAGRSMDHGDILAAYEGTPIAQIRQMREELVPSGDPDKMARVIAGLTLRDDAPLRLTLGSDAYTLLQQILPKRLEQLEAEKELTLSTDTEHAGAASDGWKQLLK
ncbi:SDR family oxidoreductase [Paenibacillus doosanensis]|uniref:SDR family oxidoreductase n=1 Tax=Paenibacillus doosanensis TaxID=1229154 RepID=UPI00217F4819|nr:SDR family oxidoreductase [Paenibacillus doosanensis]MCS7459678.1 SDR family oxidoreductase [Paenibacillus doosanensis]